MADTKLQRLDRISYLLDNSIKLPFVNYRIGVDAVIGVIPGIGDVIGVALSSWVVFEAARFGLNAATLGRMVWNVVLEALIGAIPLLGDVFDATFKANARNVQLLKQRMAEGETGAKADKRFLLLLLLGLLGLVVGLAVGAAVLVALAIDALV